MYELVPCLVEIFAHSPEINKFNDSLNVEVKGQADGFRH
jgi:hypothetical protein